MKNLIWFVAGAVVACWYCKNRNERELEELRAGSVANASLTDLLAACKKRLTESAPSAQELLEKLDDLTKKLTE